MKTSTRSALLAAAALLLLIAAVGAGFTRAADYPPVPTFPLYPTGRPTLPPYPTHYIEPWEQIWLPLIARGGA